MKRTVLALVVGVGFGFSTVFAGEFQLIEPKNEDLNSSKPVMEEQFLDHKPAILGQRDKQTQVRNDLVSLIHGLSEGKDEIREQLFVHSRAHDLFLTASNADDAYNAYLLMSATKYCLTSLGLGKEGAKNVLLLLAKKQINTELRRLAAGRADRLLASGDYPPLAMYTDNSNYCQYTTPKITEKSRTTQAVQSAASAD
ncbi:MULTISPECIES: hypothetical protein [Vibrio]|uniref:Uncharacterized protein n=3 Tax=Vibrio TaxID=662 RepID=A0AAN0W191_9VIBR|nr:MULTISPECIES: hypothetical protein [Vibrio]CAH1583210.1 conserved hypothetical protein [Vibrio jasicida]AIW22476.1 hypothetical protein IX92_25765 [Vibrio coralliilyticus]KIF53412.1 hypothetical protein H735_10865 [Vibrio owensii CAIM 1854 = LMG 25443]NOH37037.1 hypothetical protein [Vibrio coralliilyticus]PAW00762.1 hypothetical protein CKJ79_25255 [Vibrio coralliilyticus]